MYAFVSHESACDVARLVGDAPRWPPTTRALPQECVSGQREFRGCRIGERLDALGLTERPVDLLVPAQGARSSGNRARFHVWSGLVPRCALLDLGGGLLASAPEFAVIQLCSAQGKLDALLDAHASAVRAEAELAAALDLTDRPVIDHPLKWERIRRLVAATVVACEFAGTYRLAAGEKNVDYRAPRLLSAERLAGAADEVATMQGTSRARRVCELMLEGSASPMETVLGLMLTLPVDFGGFGLEKPQLNHPIDVSAYRGSLSDWDAVTPDFLWAAHGVVLEYDSVKFHAARGTTQLERDAVRANTLTALGYRTFRATVQTLGTLPGLALLARQLAHALGTELEPTTPLQDLRRRKLYLQLMPKVRNLTGGDSFLINTV